MTERASKPAEPTAGDAHAPVRLETTEIEPGAFDDVSHEDAARIARGERLRPRAPTPAAGGDDRKAVADPTPIDLPVQASAYEPPRELPRRTDHDTFEMRTVAVETETDSRRAPTQRKLRSPVEKKDTIPDAPRREPTLRGLHAGAPSADEEPPSGGPAPVVVPGAEAEGWVEEEARPRVDSVLEQLPLRSLELAEPDDRKDEEEPAPAPPALSSARPPGNKLGKLALVVAGGAIIVALAALAAYRKPPAEKTSEPTPTGTQGLEAAVQPAPSEPKPSSTQAAPLVEAPVESAGAASKPKPEKRGSPQVRPPAPEASAKPAPSAPPTTSAPKAAPANSNPFGPGVF